jgi:hypothetical protein
MTAAARPRWPALVFVAASVALAAALARVALGGKAHDGGEHRQTIEVLGEDCGPGHERPCEPYSISDPVLGFAYRPGTYRVSLRVEGESEPLVFSSQSDAEGYRATSADPSKFEGKPALWIFGCSFTWGYSVDWDRTFPALFQAARPDLAVRNLAGVGFGNTQALLQLRDRLETRRESPPEYAVFAYAAFHPERNVGSPVVLRRWGPMPGFKHPRAALDPTGRLVVDLVEFDDLDRPVPGPDEARRVTMAVFDEILALSRRHGITPVLAVQTLTPNDGQGSFATLDDEPVVRHAREAGFVVVDQLVPHAQDGWNSLPWDGHPNARAHAEYARKLLEAFRERGW